MRRIYHQLLGSARANTFVNATYTRRLGYLTVPSDMLRPARLLHLKLEKSAAEAVSQGNIARERNEKAPAKGEEQNETATVVNSEVQV